MKAVYISDPDAFLNACGDWRVVEERVERQSMWWIERRTYFGRWKPWRYSLDRQSAERACRWLITGQYLGRRAAELLPDAMADLDNLRG